LLRIQRRRCRIQRRCCRIQRRSGAGGSAGGGPPLASVKIHLEKTFASPTVISFGVPVSPGTVKDVGRIEVRVAGSVRAGPGCASCLLTTTLAGNRTSAASVGVQLAGSVMTGSSLDVEVVFAGTAPAALSGSDRRLFGCGCDARSSPLIARTTVRGIASEGGSYKLTEAAPVDKTLFVGSEPKVLATYPEGYLATTACSAGRPPRPQSQPRTSRE
jgi:hypothetical protein